MKKTPPTTSQTSPTKISVIDQSLKLDSFLLICKEQVRAKRFLAQLKEQIKLATGTAPKISFLRAEQLNLKDLNIIEQELRNLDLFGDSKLLVILGIDQLKANVSEKISTYSSFASPNARLILQATRLPANSRLLKFYTQQSAVINIPELKGTALKSWVQAEFKSNQIPPASLEVIDALLQTAENSPDRLVVMIEQLACYSNGAAVSLQDLKEIFTSTNSNNQYELINQISLNKKAAAEILLEQLRNSGISIFIMLAILARAYQNLLAIKIAQETNYNENELCRELQINPWQLQKIKPLSRNYSRQDLIDRYWNFSEIDLKLKSKSIGEANIGTALLTKLYPREKNNVL